MINPSPKHPIIFFLLFTILASTPTFSAQEAHRDCIPLNNSTQPSQPVVNDTNTRSGTWIRATCTEPYVISGGLEYSDFVCSDGIWKPAMPRCTLPVTEGGSSNDQLKWALIGAILGGACCVAVVVLIVCLHSKSKKKAKEHSDSESKCDLDLYTDDDVHSISKSSELRGIPDYFSQERMSRSVSCQDDISRSY